MATASAFEQYMLELINHARLAPQENFARYVSSYDPLKSDDAGVQSAISYFGVSGSVLKKQVAALKSTDPLAWNSALNNAATGHSQVMVKEGVQSHTINGSTLGSRAKAAGYDYFTLGENIFAYSKDAFYAHAAFMIDWGNTDTGIQNGAGHRANIMSSGFREVGIGVVENVNRSETGVGPNVVTQDFGNQRGLAETILLGAIRDERDGDGYYSMGEGRGNVTVRVAGGDATQSEAAGGYRVDTAAGDQKITFSGGGLKNSVTVTAKLHKGNAKIDLVDGQSLEASVDLTLGSGARNAAFIGDNGTTIGGNSSANHLVGNGLDNTLSGKGGNDKLVGRAGKDTLTGGTENDRLFGGSGADRLDAGMGKDVLRGGNGYDTLLGRRGADVLDGGPGNDRLIGGDGKDVFLFDDDKFGRDTITSLDDDVIRITAKGEADTRAELRAALKDSADGVVYDHNGDGENTILIRGTSLAELDLGQFDLA